MIEGCCYRLSCEQPAVVVSETLVESERSNGPAGPQGCRRQVSQGPSHPTTTNGTPVRPSTFGRTPIGEAHTVPLRKKRLGVARSMSDERYSVFMEEIKDLPGNEKMISSFMDRNNVGVQHCDGVNQGGQSPWTEFRSHGVESGHRMVRCEPIGCCAVLPTKEVDCEALGLQHQGRCRFRPGKADSDKRRIQGDRHER